jgi:hypothetical protein
MKIKIVQSFSRFPDGGGREEEFHKGSVVDVSDADAELFKKKGHAVDLPAAPAPIAPTAKA